jgi:tetratricopeptide (TPR) repeat protein
MLGEAHPDVAQVLANIASVKQSLGRLDEAFVDFERAMAILEARPATEEVKVPSIFNNYAALLQALGRYDEARAYFQKSIDMWKKADAGQPLVGVGLCNIADLELQRDRPQEAADLAREGMRRLEAGLDPRHLHVGFAASTLGRAELALGNVDAGLPLLRRGVEILTEGKADAQALAEAELGLARGIVESGGDGSEALTLATAAELRYRKAGNKRGLDEATALLTRLRD